MRIRKCISWLYPSNKWINAIKINSKFNLMDCFNNFGLINRNLKISNVLIDNDAIIKITDLNIFKRTPEVLNYLKSTSSAPETLLRNELSSKSDIWSAGIVLLEVSELFIIIKMLFLMFNLCT